MSFAPGKLILSGEHAVVYGFPAIAMPLSLGITTTIHLTQNRSTCDIAPQGSMLWKAIKTVVPENGMDISIQSNLPMGKGLGSSAALSVSLCREVARIQGHHLPLPTLLSQAMQMEKVFHGTPSGLDHTVSALEQSILFHKGATGLEWEPIDMPSLPILIVDSQQTGSTKALVAQVASHAHTPKTSRVLQQIGTLTQKISQALQQHQTNQLGQMFTENHLYLKEIGVSTPILDNIVQQAITWGAEGAKLSGSGGGGVVMVIGKNLDLLAQKFRTIGYDTYIVSPYQKTLNSTV